MKPPVDKPTLRSVIMRFSSHTFFILFFIRRWSYSLSFISFFFRRVQTAAWALCSRLYPIARVPVNSLSQI